MGLLHTTPVHPQPLLSGKIICIGELGGPEHGLAIAYVVASPGGRTRRAYVSVNDHTAKKIAALTSGYLWHGDYEADPATFEDEARQTFTDAAPELMAMIAYAREVGAVVTEVIGVPVPTELPPMPLDGTVDEARLRCHIFNLMGALAGGWGLSGCAHAGADKTRRLRVFTPNSFVGMPANGHGLPEDDYWQTDNPGQLILRLTGSGPDANNPKAAYSAMIAVGPPSGPSMQIATLADLVDAVARQYGGSLVDELQRPNYAIGRTAIQPRDSGAVGVPLLLRDGRGQIHGHIPARDVRGLTREADDALQVFREVINEPSVAMQIAAVPGSLLIYSNTQTMYHRPRSDRELGTATHYYLGLYLAPRSYIIRSGAGPAYERSAT